jgi:hypothetical protein
VDQIASDSSNAPPPAAGRDDAPAAAAQHSESSASPAALGDDAPSHQGPGDPQQAQYVTYERTDTDDAAVTMLDDTPAVQPPQRKVSVRSFPLADTEAPAGTAIADNAGNWGNPPSAGAGAVPLPKTSRSWKKNSTAWYPDAAGIQRPPG